MKTRLKILLPFLLESSWHASRYTFAVGVTAPALVILPMILLFVTAIVAGIATVIFSVTMLLSAIMASADPPIFAFLFAIVLPILYVIGIILAFIVIVVVILTFVILVILPISALTELILGTASKRSIFVRISGFVGAGLLTGAMVDELWVLYGYPTEPMVELIILMLTFIVLMASVSLFGIALTATGFVRRLLESAMQRFRTRVTSTDESLITASISDI